MSELETGIEKIQVTETPVVDINHPARPNISEFAMASVEPESRPQAVGEDLLSFAESLVSLADERITLKRSFTPEGLAVKAASNLFAKPFRKIVSKKEVEVLKTRAAIVAESLRTGLTPKKSIKGRDKLLAAALGAEEKVNRETAGSPIDKYVLYNDILVKHGLTPAESMKLAEGAFGGREKPFKKVAAAAAVISLLFMSYELGKPDSSHNSQMASAVGQVALPATSAIELPSPTTTTTTEAPKPTAPPTTVPTTTVPPTTAPPTTVPPIVYSKYQIGLGERYSFRLHAEPLEAAAAGLTAKLGERWDVTTLRDYTGIKPGFIGTTAVQNCPNDTSVLVRSGDTLEKIAQSNHTTVLDIKKLMPDGEPKVLAGLCMPIPPKHGA